jgi:hypothetical protein
MTLVLHGVNVRRNERTNQADKDSYTGDSDGEHHGIPSTTYANTASNNQSSASTFGKGSKQV